MGLRFTLVALFFVVTARAAEHRVSSAAEILRVAAEGRPGDVLVMSDGVWQDQAVVFRCQGTAEKPITLRAQTPGQVILAGKSSLTIDGEHLLVGGLFLKDGPRTVKVVHDVCMTHRLSTSLRLLKSGWRLA